MIDTKKLDELKVEHPRAVAFTAGGVTVVAVPPSRVQWRRFKACIRDEQKRVDAFEVLLRDCAIYPDKAGIEAMLEERPALAEVFGDEIAGLAGAGLEVEKNG
jgi:hypothetical protein